MRAALDIFYFVIMLAIIAFVAFIVDVPSIQLLTRQYHAQSYPSTDGRILSSDVYTTIGSKGRTYYHLAITYTYTVNDHTYNGRRYRYSGTPTDSASVNEIVTALPPGSPVQVYYNPVDPWDALLSPMISAQNVSGVLISLPFHLLFIYVLFSIGSRVAWPGRTEPVVGGVKILVDGLTTRVRLPRYRPILLGSITAGAISLIAGLVFQRAFKSSPVPAGVGALLIVIAAGVGVYLWQYLRIASGSQDLIIDERARTIELPLNYKRRERRPLPYSMVRGITLKKVAHARRYGVSYTYAPMLELNDNSVEQLTDLKEANAESFAARLEDKLGLHSPDNSLIPQDDNA